MPTQPAVLAWLNNTTNYNVTGDGTYHTPTSWSTIGVYNDNFNASTGVFTAPVTGLYFVHFHWLAGGIASGHNQAYCQINTSNRDWGHWQHHPGNNRDNNNNLLFQITAVVDMDVNDTLSVRGNVWGQSSKTVDFLADSWPGPTYLNIRLVQ